MKVADITAGATYHGADPKNTREVLSIDARRMRLTYRPTGKKHMYAMEEGQGEWSITVVAFARWAQGRVDNRPPDVATTTATEADDALASRLGHALIRIARIQGSDDKGLGYYINAMEGAAIRLAEEPLPPIGLVKVICDREGAAGFIECLVELVTTKPAAVLDPSEVAGMAARTYRAAIGEGRSPDEAEAIAVSTTVDVRARVRAEYAALLIERRNILAKGTALTPKEAKRLADVESAMAEHAGEPERLTAFRLLSGLIESLQHDRVAPDLSEPNLDVLAARLLLADFAAGNTGPRYVTIFAHPIAGDEFTDGVARHDLDLCNGYGITAEDMADLRRSLDGADLGALPADDQWVYVLCRVLREEGETDGDGNVIYPARDHLEVVAARTSAQLAGEEAAR